MNVTSALAELAIQVTYEDINLSARQATKRMILDTLATAVAGWREEGVSPVVEQMRHWSGREEATLWTYGGAMPAPNAAFANSCMIHALDYDDKYYEGGLHIMSSVLPVSLAVAEMEHASGEEVLSAVTLGVEVGGRIGVLALQRGLTRGFLPASVVGGFGATASACRLLGFDVEQTVNALGIYYAQTSGNRQALLDHTLTKRMQPAYSARSALWSAFLAKRGVTGARNAMEGEAGFFKVYARSEPPDVAEVAGLRDSFQIEQLWIKQYPSCGGAHRSAKAAIDLATREDLQVRDIKDIDLYVGENGIWFVGTPFEIRQHPQVDAQFSATYAVALGLVHRRAGLAQYATESIVSDETVLDIARRVRIHEKEGTKGKRTDLVPVTLEVTTHDGRTLSSTALELKGSPDDPMTYDEVADKYRECANYAGVLSQDHIEEVISAVGSFETVEDVAQFVQDMLVAQGVA